MERDGPFARQRRQAVDRVVVTRHLRARSQMTLGDLARLAVGDLFEAGFHDLARENAEPALTLVMVMDTGLGIFPEQGQQHPRLARRKLNPVVSTGIEHAAALNGLAIQF